MRHINPYPLFPSGYRKKESGDSDFSLFGHQGSWYTTNGTRVT
jgi:hypothetical protein